MASWRDRESATQARSREENESTARAIRRPNHENPESEQVIGEHEPFAVVETVSGEAAQLARRSYPRQWRGREPRLETRK
jgi:hypothetical protein